MHIFPLCRNGRSWLRSIGIRMIFISVASQRDNLGDSILRRPMVRSASGAGPRHIFVGSGAEDWTNLEVQAGDVLYTRRSRWMFALARSAAVRRTSLLLNSGELLPDRRFVLVRALLLPAILAIKLRGGALIHAGFGVREPNKRLPLIARVVLRCSDIVSWRDEASRAIAGIGTVVPDWALSDGPTPETLKDRHEVDQDRVIALSLRGDRAAPSEEWLHQIRHIAENELDARLVVVCQVRKDATRAAWLAERTGAELINWPDEVDHGSHETTVRETYGRASWIVSDRLHSVLVALSEGAVPLDVMSSNSPKVLRNLAVIGLRPFASEGAAQRLSRDREQVRVAIHSARARLTEQSVAIDGALRGNLLRKLTVLHTISPPDCTTRYARHMASTEDFDITPKFVSWASILMSGVDAIHVHWPEHFVPAGTDLRSRLMRLRARLIWRHVMSRRIPVIRTLHNLAPHTGLKDARGRRLRSEIDAATVAEIHLVPEPGAVTNGAVHAIPHGDYRDPYADLDRESVTPGRVLFFGRIAAYKGISELISASKFSSLSELRFVGDVQDPTSRDEIREATRVDDRLSYRFGFVPDRDLALEITAAALCVFPYRELHSSGAVLVALSLDRPVLVPRTRTTESLLDEVGDSWVMIYDHLDQSALDKALKWSNLDRTLQFRPSLHARSWQKVRERHSAVVRQVVSRKHGVSIV